MKSRILASAFCCILASGLSAQVFEAPDQAITTIAFEEPTFDFGRVDQGVHVRNVFTFTNTGEHPLVISSAKGSCGCTVPQWPSNPVMPGETASITVEFDTRGKTGAQMKKVTITANTDPQQTFVYVKGEVISADGLPEAEPEAEEDTPTPHPDCFEIAPNPTAEILFLKMEESRIGKPATVSIFSLSGDLMAQRHFSEAAATVEFEVSHYPAGIYVAKVQLEEGGFSSQCFVVSR